MVRKEYVGAAAPTRLSGALAVGTTTSFAVITSGGSGYPSGATAPFVVVIDRGTALEEKILVTSRAGDTFSGLTRGYDGTTAQAHSAQAVVEHVLDAASVQEANLHTNDVARDDHTQYFNAARHAATPHTAAMIQDLTLTTADIADGAVTYAKLAAGQRWEPGDFKWSMQTADHAGWLKMDGRNNLARVGQYAPLFAVVGTSMGAGDGSTTFGIADVSKRTLIGKTAAGVGSTLGGTGGSADAALVTHSHTVNSHSHGGGTAAEGQEHVHTINHGHTADDNQTGDHRHSLGGDDGNRFAVSHGAAARGLHDAGLEKATFSAMDLDGAHNHDITVNAHNGNSGGRSATHTHGVNAEAPGTNAQGVAATDLNMPPFLVMNGFIHI